jgi:hypothetical protein
MDAVELLNARKDEMCGSCGTYQGENAYRVLARKPEGKNHSENLA